MGLGQNGMQLCRWRLRCYRLLVARRVAECSDFQRKSLWDLALMLGSIFTPGGSVWRNAPDIRSTPLAEMAKNALRLDRMDRITGIRSVKTLEAFVFSHLPQVASSPDEA